jgi:hypothetical protein
MVISRGQLLGETPLAWRTPAEVWLLPLFGLVGTVLYSFTQKPFSAAFMQVLGVSLLIGGASFVVGALLGFLFGIPRALRTDDSITAAELARGQRYAGNSNLEQISDWLTKILIGAGLVQLGVLVGQIGDLSNSLGDALGTDTAADTVALALTLYFFGSGFLVIYLYTRLDFGPLIARTEEDYSPPVPQEPPPLPPAPPAPADESLESGDGLKPRDAEKEATEDTLAKSGVPEHDEGVAVPSEHSVDHEAG